MRASVCAIAACHPRRGLGHPQNGDGQRRARHHGSSIAAAPIGHTHRVRTSWRVHRIASRGRATVASLQGLLLPTPLLLDFAGLHLLPELGRASRTGPRCTAPTSPGPPIATHPSARTCPRRRTRCWLPIRILPAVRWWSFAGVIAPILRPEGACSTKCGQRAPHVPPAPPRHPTTNLLYLRSIES